MNLTSLERQVLWFRYHGVRYPTIARNLGISYRVAKSAGLSAMQKANEQREREARDVLRCFNAAAPRPAHILSEGGPPRARLVIAEDLAPPLELD